MSFKVYVNPDDLKAVSSEWNQLVQRYSNDVSGLDITASYDWTNTLWQTREDVAEKLVVVEKDLDTITAILPLYKSKSKLFFLSYDTMALFSNLYGGRQGLILSEVSQKSIENLIGYAADHIHGWGTLTLSFVRGSTQERLCKQTLSNVGLQFELIAEAESPYIELDSNWDDFLKSMPKKLRWTMKSSEKRLREIGQVEYKHFTRSDEVDEFLEAVMIIESDSWKNEAGTAISKNEFQENFYRHFTPSAAKNNWLSGHLLTLDGEPIAYIYGMSFGSTFYDFKESYKETYKKYSPGHVLKSFAFPELISRDISIYDFMGKCEDYKMRWTDKKYGRVTYIVYNKTLVGKMLALKSKLIGILRKYRKA
ncbi:MAG: GNAT family N-acetyltransferase [Hahellaceae bacterium]|nr:GNAT family N-acetyltransferase [Hahellaceae bacterium]MCP5213145.1 GNAT family N-acetyltransferase [Hahellaceae bacterium]